MTLIKKVGNKTKYKYDNRIKVSFPDEIYEGMRKWAIRKGISYQDLNRKALEFYLNFLEQNEVQTQKKFKT